MQSLQHLSSPACVSTTCCISSTCSYSREHLTDHFLSWEALMVHHRKCITLKMLHLQRHLKHFSYRSHEIPWKNSVSFPVLSVIVPLGTLILPSRCLQSWDFLSHPIDLSYFLKLLWHIVNLIYSFRLLLEASSLRMLNLILQVWGNLFELVLSQFCVLLIDVLSFLYMHLEGICIGSIFMVWKINKMT